MKRYKDAGKILEMYKKGMDEYQIAKVLGHPHSSCVSHILRLLWEKGMLPPIEGKLSYLHRKCFLTPFDRKVADCVMEGFDKIEASKKLKVHQELVYKVFRRLTERGAFVKVARNQYRVATPEEIEQVPDVVPEEERDKEVYEKYGSWIYKDIQVPDQVKSLILSMYQNGVPKSRIEKELLDRKVVLHSRQFHRYFLVKLLDKWTS